MRGVCVSAAAALNCVVGRVCVQQSGSVFGQSRDGPAEEPLLAPPKCGTVTGGGGRCIQQTPPAVKWGADTFNLLALWVHPSISLSLSL